MSNVVNSVRSDKSHMFGGNVAGAFMAHNDNKNIDLFKQKEHNIDLSGVSVWSHPQTTA